MCQSNNYLSALRWIISIKMVAKVCFNNSSRHNIPVFLLRVYLKSCLGTTLEDWMLNRAVTHYILFCPTFLLQKTVLQTVTTNFHNNGRLFVLIFLTLCCVWNVQLTQTPYSSYPAYVCGLLFLSLLFCLAYKGLSCLAIYKYRLYKSQVKSWKNPFL